MDPMHIVDLGIWTHLLTCIAHTYDATLNKYQILKGGQISAVWDKLGKRSQEMLPDDTMFRLNEYKAKYMSLLLKNARDPTFKMKTVEAWEHHLLMLVQTKTLLHAGSVLFLYCTHSEVIASRSCACWQALPFLLKDLIKDEVELINSTLRRNNVSEPPVKDPSSKMQLVLNALNDWYNHLRQPIYTAAELVEIQEKTRKLMWLFKTVFPSKSGVHPATVT